MTTSGTPQTPDAGHIDMSAAYLTVLEVMQAASDTNRPTLIPEYRGRILEPHGHIAQEATRKAMRVVMEALNEEAMKHWQAYKRGHGPERGNPYYEGASDLLEQFAQRIQVLLDQMPEQAPAKSTQVPS